MDSAPAQLIVRLRQGDEQAWSDLHRENYPRLWSSVERIINNPSMSDDVVQESFVKAHREIHRFQGHSQLSTWLYRIAVNHALDTLRKRQRLDRRISFFSPVAEEDHLSLLPEGQVPSQVTQGLEMAELRTKLQKALGQLSPEHRAVVQLRMVEEMSLEETAKILKCKPGTINSRLHYACQYLKGILQKSRE